MKSFSSADERQMPLRRILRWVVHTVGALVVAGLITEWRGFSLFDPYFFVPFACLSAMLASTIVASGPVSLRRAVPQACAVPAVILALSIGLLNLAAPAGIWVSPHWPLILETTVLTAAAGTGTAVLAGFLTHRYSAQTVRWIFRAAVLSGILVWRYWPLT